MSWNTKCSTACSCLPQPPTCKLSSRVLLLRCARAAILRCLPSRSRKLTRLVLQGHHRGEFLS